MNIYFKTIITLFLLGLLVAVSAGAFKIYSGNFFSTASLLTCILVVFAFLVFINLIIAAILKIWKTLAIILIISLQACSYAKSNQQVVVSTDCGMSWKKINVGDAVPKEGMNRCYMKVVMPNYPMQGDCRFVSNFAEKVRAAVHIDYDYSITDPLAFIKQAKYLGKANADADDQAALDASAFEGAENMVIDKRIRDVSKGILLKEDIVELDQAGLEAHLFTETNKILEPLGVHLNFITLTFDLDEQTRQAIDVSTAMKIYDSKSLGDIGKQVMAARAGATKITVENKMPQQVSE